MGNQKMSGKKWTAKRMQWYFQYINGVITNKSGLINGELGLYAV